VVKQCGSPSIYDFLYVWKTRFGHFATRPSIVSIVALITSIVQQPVIMGECFKTVYLGYGRSDFVLRNIHTMGIDVE